MIRKRIKAGDIILVPIEDAKCAFAKIIYFSKRYKNVILLNIYCLTVETSEQCEASHILQKQAGKGLLIYTTTHKIKTGEWKVISYEAISDEEKQMSKRIVAGNVWIEDESIGVATEDDYKTLLDMTVAGTKVVEEKIKKYLLN
jgi:Immunity protein 26